MMSVGSSSPRFGSMTRRENLDSIAPGAEDVREVPRHAGRADVVGDVPAHLLVRQAERPAADLVRHMV
jgi:hypothetical protein